MIGKLIGITMLLCGYGIAAIIVSVLISIVGATLFYLFLTFVWNLMFGT